MWSSSFFRNGKKNNTKTNTPNTDKVSGLALSVTSVVGVCSSNTVTNVDVVSIMLSPGLFLGFLWLFPKLPSDVLATKP